MTFQDLDNARIELSVKAKNGVDFITAASLIWITIGIIWAQPYSSYNKSVLTFIASGVMLPLAFAFSKLYKTQWKIEGNPLQPLGLILNFAQLFYFPFLVLCLIKFPNYFVLTYAVITGAHFFPYAWFYNERAYAIFAGVIALGALAIGLIVEVQTMFYVPFFTSLCLVILGSLLFISSRRRGLSHARPY